MSKKKSEEVLNRIAPDKPQKLPELGKFDIEVTWIDGSKQVITGAILTTREDDYDPPFQTGLL